MKIGYVLDDGLDKPDGVQQYVLTLGRWMTSHGHDVRYLVGETKRTDITGLYSMSKNIRVHFNGNALSIPLPASSRRIKKVLQEEAFDIIHVQTPHSPFMAAKIVNQAYEKTAVVGTFHIMPYGWISRIGTRLLGVWLQNNLKKFDRILSVSPPASEFAARSFKVTTQIVPNTVDLKKFQTNTGKGSHQNLRILFLGRLVERKGCRQLLEAIVTLKKSGKLPDDVQLDICGNGILRRELETFVRQNGLSEAVTFRGFVSNQEKISFMQQSDIAVFPSLAGESFGIVLLEAMAAGGGIVLGGDNPGYRSVLASAPDSLINAAQPEILAEQLLEMINDNKKRRQLFESQQALVKKFDVNVVAAEMSGIYQACINQRSN